MTFSDRSSARFLRLPRRVAGTAALCAAAATISGLAAEPTRLDAARRPEPMGADVGCALLVPHAVTSVLKAQQPRVDTWCLARSRLQQEYDLEGVIGEGGFGLVHVARHRASNARVAVKRVPKQLTTKENFLQEVAILRQVGGTHNVLQLRDAFETPDAYVLVTELVQGAELYDDLVEHGVFGEQRAKALVRELAVALQYLHSKHVVHADLKPENILLADDKETSMRLIDFGQSFCLQDARRNVDACTTAYASPEFIEQRESGCAMDVWALGVVLYIVLCGVHPFDPTDDASDEELQRRILKGDFDRDSAGWVCMSDSARDLVFRMLNVNPEQRISAAQVLEHEWVEEAQVLQGATAATAG